MKRYTVYFEIYGKKMKTTVEAIAPEVAREIVKNKLVVLKIEENRTTDAFSYLFDIVNGKK